MMIRDMFFDDINRKVNGVIKVDQDETAVVSQEVRERSEERSCRERV